MASKELWRKLNGIFCIYKPPLVRNEHVINSIKFKLAKDLNEHFSPKPENQICIEGSVEENLSVNVSEKLSVHPLAIGDIYCKNDFNVKIVNLLAVTTSGVVLCSINRGIRQGTAIRHQQLIRTYRMQAVLGIGTVNLHVNGKVMEKSRYTHVTRPHVDRVLMNIQAAHQKRAIQYIGMPINSQETYEALKKDGIVRPGYDSAPLAYSLSCVKFNPPYFEIEISCINEDEIFLRHFIKDVGLMLKTNATTSQIRCLRYGPFTLDDALLRKHWSAEHIANNIEAIKPKLDFMKHENASLKNFDRSEVESESSRVSRASDL